MGKEALNSKIPKETNIPKIDIPIRKTTPNKTVLDKSKALQTSSSLLNMTLLKTESNYCENNPILDKLDTLITFCKELSAGQIEIRKKLTELDQTIKTITGRVHIDQIEEAPSASENSVFSKELIEQARTRLSLNLDVDLVYNGKHLLRHAFNYTNINTFGTTLLSELFKLRELNAGTVEPTKSTTPSLDQKRVDLIKVCYLKKLKTIEAFEYYWPSIVKSLRQKCIDVKSNIKKKGHLWNKLQEELIVDGLVLNDNSQAENYNYEDNLDGLEENQISDYEIKAQDESEQMEELGLI